MPENLTRREFLRAVGIAGAGVTLTAGSGAAIVSAADSKPVETPRRFWWAKEVSKPTIEIDWKAMKRFNEWETTRGSLKQYRGDALDAEMLKLQKDNLLKWELESKPGYTTKDTALKEAISVGRPAFKFRGEQKVSTPKDRGVPRYEGTPEENAQVVRAALKHIGAASVGFVELDENTIKLIYNQEPAPSKMPIVFEDVEEGSEEKDKLIIPRKARWVVVFTTQMSGETMKRAPTQLGSLTTTLSYTRMWLTLAQAHEFFRALGWQSYGPTQFNGLGIYPAFAVLAGLGEMSRLNRMVSPEYGPMVRATMLVTDLPLAPSKPISFGVMDFCKECMTCATTCPSKSLSFDREPSWEPKGPWSNTGHKAYFENSVTCRNFWNTCGTNCGICFANCPYAQEDKATLHEILKATTATTPMFNGLIRQASDMVYPSEWDGRPIKDPESWWRNPNLPEYGIDTMQGGREL
jgi:epoxyqueuosine reductase